MKNFLLPIAFVFLVVCGFSSCKKCSTCSYTFTDAQGHEQTYEYAEACGSKKDIEAYEAEAAATALEFDGTATCVKN